MAARHHPAVVSRFWAVASWPRHDPTAGVICPYESYLARLPPPPRGGGTCRPGPARPVRYTRLAGPVGRAHGGHAAGPVDVLRRGRPVAGELDLDGIPGAAGREDHGGHPLRDPVV